jgi:di/tricarboxylate transporter
MPGPHGRFGRRLAALDPSWVALPVGVVAAILTFVYAPLPGEMATMLAITAFCVSLWVGTPVPPWFTGLLAVGLVGVVFSTDLALVGFRSAATWLIVLGLLLGAATERSGLGDLVERGVVRGIPARATGDALATYRYLLVVCSAAALAAAVLVPSSLVRVLVLGPILASVGDLFSERRARVGLFLGPLFVTYYGGVGVFTGSLANIIIAGIVETNAGVRIGWVEWAVWMGPLFGVVRAVLVVAVAYALYRPTDRAAVRTATTDAGGEAARDTDVDGDENERGDESADGDENEVGVTVDGTIEIGAAQRRMLLFLLVGVAVWATDAVHGLHPLYGALVVVLLAVAPRIGVVGPDAVADVDFSIVFFVGAIFAIAEGLRRTAFTDLAARSVLSSLPGDASLAVVLGAVVVVTLALTFVMEGLAVASVLTPVLVSFAVSAGVPLVPVAMMEAAALNAYFFPYQSAVLVAILGLDVVDGVELARMASVCSLVTLLVVVPAQIALFVAAF